MGVTAIGNVNLTEWHMGGGGGGEKWTSSGGGASGGAGAGIIAIFCDNINVASGATIAARGANGGNNRGHGAGGGAGGTI